MVSDGSAMTPADVAFTYNLLKKYPDINTAGSPITGTSVSGNDVTVNFSSPQYTNLQYIGNVYIVPQSIWSTVGDPATFTDRIRSAPGPTCSARSAPPGITLNGQPELLGRQRPAISAGRRSRYASNNTVLSALTTNQLDWAGNFLTGLQAAFIKPAPATTGLVRRRADQQPGAEPQRLADEPAGRPPGDQPRDRPHGDQQAGRGRPRAGRDQRQRHRAAELQARSSPAVKQDTLSPHAKPKAADKLSEGRRATCSRTASSTSATRKSRFTITDPSAYTDYAEDDSLVAHGAAEGAHQRDVRTGQSATAWAADIATGQVRAARCTGHRPTISAYQLYNDWLNSALATEQREPVTSSG